MNVLAFFVSTFLFLTLSAPATVTVAVFAGRTCSGATTTLQTFTDNPNLCQVSRLTNGQTLYLKGTCSGGTQLSASICSDSSCSNCSTITGLLPSGQCGLDLSGQGGSSFYLCTPATSGTVNVNLYSDTSCRTTSASQSFFNDATQCQTYINAGVTTYLKGACVNNQLTAASCTSSSCTSGCTSLLLVPATQCGSDLSGRGGSSSYTCTNSAGLPSASIVLSSAMMLLILVLLN